MDKVLRPGIEFTIKVVANGYILTYINEAWASYNVKDRGTYPMLVFQDMDSLIAHVVDQGEMQ